MAQPSSSEGDDKVVGYNGSEVSIKRVEFVKVITKALYSLGYKKTAEHLEKESGIPLHSPMVNLFMQQILDGNWDEGIATLNQIGQSERIYVRDALLLILLHKFLELLDGDKVMLALETLRTEIAPLCDYGIRIRQLSQLTSCLVYRQEVRAPMSRLTLLEELKKLLPSTVMIPEKRLEYLVEQTLLMQRRVCVFHNSLKDEEMSLYSDHYCGKTQIPCRTLQILEEHDDEVWFVKFSHNGKYLASASNDQTAIIWEVDTTNGNGVLSAKHKLCGHQKPVSSVSWSPNDQELLTCGVEETVRRWDVSTGMCLQVYEKDGHGMISCAWVPSGKNILSGFNDKSICMWELDGQEVKSWNGQKTLRISDLDMTGDGKHILSICNDNAILIFNIETEEERFIVESHTITSFFLSKDSRFLLVNLLNQEIHLWSLELIQVFGIYKSHKGSRFVIRSCFGGADQAFIASGSEDSQVYIWDRRSWQVIDVLAGHSGAVNCVSWNPANPHMLASASDDRTIRIWGLDEVPKCIQQCPWHPSGQRRGTN